MLRIRAPGMAPATKAFREKKKYTAAKSRAKIINARQKFSHAARGRERRQEAIITAMAKTTDSANVGRELNAPRVGCRQVTDMSRSWYNRRNAALILPTTNPKPPKTTPPKVPRSRIGRSRLLLCPLSSFTGKILHLRFRKQAQTNLSLDLSSSLIQP